MCAEWRTFILLDCRAALAMTGVLAVHFIGTAVLYVPLARVFCSCCNQCLPYF